MLDRFRTIVVGVDGSEESFAALVQARRLLAPGGRLTALTVCEERLAVPSECLLAAAIEQEADLIAVGSHEHTAAPPPSWSAASPARSSIGRRSRCF
jgi:nucleotide-binding universal stress UspA family protein